MWLDQPCLLLPFASPGFRKSDPKGPAPLESLPKELGQKHWLLCSSKTQTQPEAAPLCAQHLLAPHHVLESGHLTELMLLGHTQSLLSLFRTSVTDVVLGIHHVTGAPPHIQSLYHLCD